MPGQVGHDGTECHPERSEGSLMQRKYKSDSFTIVSERRFFDSLTFAQNDRILIKTIYVHRNIYRLFNQF